MLINSIPASKHANASLQDDTEELHLMPAPASPQPAFTNSELVDAEATQQLNNLDSPLWSDSDWRLSCLIYTSGFVSKKVMPKVKCEVCVEALFQEHNDRPEFKFLNRKDNGGLITPSDGVVKVVTAAERAFRTVMPSPELMETLPSESYVDRHMQNMVMSELYGQYEQLFPSIVDHFYDHEAGHEENHITRLIRLISSFFLRMRLLKAGQQYHQRQILKGQSSKRTRLKKTILFNGL